MIELNTHTHTHIRMNTRKIRKSEYKWIISKLKSVCDIIVCKMLSLGKLDKVYKGSLYYFLKLHVDLQLS